MGAPDVACHCGRVVVNWYELTLYFKITIIIMLFF